MTSCVPSELSLSTITSFQPPRGFRKRVYESSTCPSSAARLRVANSTVVFTLSDIGRQYDSLARIGCKAGASSARRENGFELVRQPSPKRPDIACDPLLCLAEVAGQVLKDSFEVGLFEFLDLEAILALLH